MDLPALSPQPNSGASDETAQSPLGPPAAPVRRAPRSLQNLGHPTGHVLVVDDDSVVRESSTRLLQRVGFAVTSAADGEAAWAALQRGTFGLLVTDNQMPRLTGIELIARIRAEGFTLPVILVSGTLPRDAAELPAKFPPLAILEKPYGWDELFALVREALGTVAAASTRLSGVVANG